MRALKFSTPAIWAGSLLMVLCALVSNRANAVTDVDLAGGSPSKQTILTSAGELRKLNGSSDTVLSREEKNKKAARYFDSGLSAWQKSLRINSTYDTFEVATVKLFDAYVNYLVDAKQPSAAVDVLRAAVVEADKDRNFTWGVIFRIRLAELLATIGQVEVAQKSLKEAQSISERVYGPLSEDMKKPDPFQMAEQASLLTANIQVGGAVDPRFLSMFATLYKRAGETVSVVKYMTPMTPSTSVLTFGKNIKDDQYYRRDQEYWRWIAVGAVRNGDRALAKMALDQMLESGEAASQNRFAEDKEWKGDYARQAKYYMQGFYLQPQNLKHQKFADPAFGLETRFDTALSGAEIYLMLGEPDEAKKMMDRAVGVLGTMERLSDELIQLGHIGLKVEQRKGELNRISGKLYLAYGRWKEALTELDKYLAWSEVYRNSLTLEERLPYFKGKSQGVYLDAILARASIFLSEPTEANFILALEAQENLKSRHLKDALESSGKLDKNRAGFVGKNIQAITRSDRSFLSVVDANEDLIVFFADKDKKKVRIVKKPASFASDILRLRNKLAEQQVFDAAGARKIAASVLGDLEPLVFEKQKLVVELDGALSYLPVELWLDSTMTPLGKRSEVSYIPSLALADTDKDANPAAGILAFADAQFEKDQHLSYASSHKESLTRGTRDGFSPLPETRDEVRAILQNVKEGGKAVLGKDASKTRFIREMGAASYRYLHFATHGVVGGEVPLLNEPALVLTPANDDSGFLTASEISKMHIPADLVVLSACNTGNGEYFNGEGLMGLGRAFIVAGAKAVVVSLWPVDSYTTMTMMIKFYQDLAATGNRSLALANARKSVMGVADQPKKNAAGKKVEAKPNPFYWAPFILIESRL